MAVVVRRRPRARRLTTVLLLIALTLVVLDRSGDASPVHPVRSAVHDAGSWVGDSMGQLWPFDDRSAALRRENADLRRQLDEAQGRLAQEADVARQRDELTSLAGIPTPDDVPKVLAPVTAIGASNFDATVELGRGSDAGIATGMPVVTGKGLVGRVIQTTPNRATVLLLTDTTAEIGIRLSRAGDVAVTAGEGMHKDLRVDLVDTSSAVEVGEVAVTSGQQHSRYPAGIPVGTVTSASAGPHDLRKDVRLRPLADLDRLDLVAVLRWTPS